jgi:hypothetical protein
VGRYRDRRRALTKRATEAQQLPFNAAYFTNAFGNMGYTVFLLISYSRQISNVSAIEYGIQAKC